MVKAVTIDGLEDMTKLLKDISPREGKNIARRTVTKTAAKVRTAMRKRAPKGPTGNLRKAIKSRRTKGKGDKVSAEVFVDKSGGPSGKGYHWHFVEYGTGPRTVKKTGAKVGAMPAQPFIVPTIEEYRPQIPAIYRTQWWTEYEKEMHKRARKLAGLK